MKEEKADVPSVGEVWGMEGYGLEGAEPDEWGFFVCSNINGLRGCGFRTTREVTDEIREKAVTKCLRSIENTWLATALDTFDMDAKCCPGPWVASRLRRLVK